MYFLQAPNNDSIINTAPSPKPRKRKQDDDILSLEECKISEEKDANDQENNSQENFVAITNQFAVALHASSEF